MLVFVLSRDIELAETQACPVNAGLDRVDVAAQRYGDIVQAVTGPELEQQWNAILARQVVQCSPDWLGIVEVCLRRRCRFVFVSQRRVCRAVADGDSRRQYSSRCGRVSSVRLHLLQIVPVSQRFAERLLALVLGRLAIAHQAIEITTYRLVIVVIELFDAYGRREYLFHCRISFADLRTTLQAFVMHVLCYCTITHYTQLSDSDANPGLAPDMMDQCVAQRARQRILPLPDLADPARLLYNLAALYAAVRRRAVQCRDGSASRQLARTTLSSSAWQAPWPKFGVIVISVSERFPISYQRPCNDWTMCCTAWITASGRSN
jgi:hypothetical protein